MLVTVSLFNRSQITLENSLRHTRTSCLDIVNNVLSIKSIPENIRDKSLRLKM